MTFLTTRSTIRTIRASVARIAHGPYNRAKIRGRGAGLARVKLSADCTSLRLSRCGECLERKHRVRFRSGRFFVFSSQPDPWTHPRVIATSFAVAQSSLDITLDVTRNDSYAES